MRQGEETSHGNDGANDSGWGPGAGGGAAGRAGRGDKRCLFSNFLTLFIFIFSFFVLYNLSNIDSVPLVVCPDVIIYGNIRYVSTLLLRHYLQ